MPQQAPTIPIKLSDRGGLDRGPIRCHAAAWPIDRGILLIVEVRHRGTSIPPNSSRAHHVQSRCHCNWRRSLVMTSRTDVSADGIAVHERMRRQRSRGSFAERGTECLLRVNNGHRPSLNSITSSAVTSSVGGTVRPSAFAAFKLINTVIRPIRSPHPPTSLNFCVRRPRFSLT